MVRHGRERTGLRGGGGGWRVEEKGEKEVMEEGEEEEQRKRKRRWRGGLLTVWPPSCGGAGPVGSTRDHAMVSVSSRRMAREADLSCFCRETPPRNT